MKIVILAGGKGTRLWPLSRQSFPKQFLNFGDQNTLLQKTIKRFLCKYRKEDIVILTNNQYVHLVKSQCSEILPDFNFHILLEPEGKNTAPAIALASKYLQESLGAQEDEVFIVSSSDHLIEPETQFLAYLDKAEQEAQKGNIVTFGVFPNSPETGYGYIKFCKDGNIDACDVEEFVEKPSKELAQKYLLSGQYLWNSGIFAFTIATFWRELEKNAEELFSHFRGFFDDCLSSFPKCQDISIDYAVLEKAKGIRVIPMSLSWSDVGSWDSVYDSLGKDSNQNVKVGNIVDIDTKNCLIMGGKKLISTLGLEDVIVVETDDAILVSKKGHSQKVKTLVESLLKRQVKQIHDHVTTHRPWGSFTTLEEGIRYKIKRILVEPKQRLSLQMHYHRSEHWVVVKGTAKVTRGIEEVLVHENESIYLPKSVVHRLENPGKVPLELIEVQVGEYVGEDDIVRLQDDYARALV